VIETGPGERALETHTNLPISELDTPALLVDLNAMEHNLERMGRFFDGRKSKLRPHFKNHRILELAARQMRNGATGITCAKLSQAEKLVHAGIRRVLIANEIAGESCLRRFIQLSQEAPVLLAIDNAAIAVDLARLAGDRSSQLNLLVDIDLGLKRCGVAPGEPAAALARKIVDRGLRLRGIMGYEGHLQPLEPGPQKQLQVAQAMAALIESKKRIEADGVAVDIVSCGGTGDYEIAGVYPGVTEIQAGSYLLMDTWYAPFAPGFRPSLSVLATVISKAPRERIVVNAGVKALSGERGLPSVKDAGGLKLKALHAEHALIEIVDPAAPVEVGDKIEISVHYHDGTIQLHRRLYGIRDGRVEEIFEIEHE
jgi:D-serine deaminase-like pyridoxal phosphate-dependent protein